MKTATEQTTEDIYQLMKEYAPEAAELLAKYQPFAINEGKSGANVIKDESASTAKTALDEIVQQLFLMRLHSVAPNVRINVEEDTSLRSLFIANVADDITVHQDPCDGTESYMTGNERYSTGYAISDSTNTFTHTVIAIPSQKRLYIASPHEFVVRNYDTGDSVTPKPSAPPKPIVYTKRVFSPRGLEAVKQAGFDIPRSYCSHQAILEVALGEAAAYIYGNSNPHDSMIPYAFAAKCGAVLVDIEGDAIDGGCIRPKNKDGTGGLARIPSVCYFNPDQGNISTLLGVLAQTKNIDHHLVLRPE